jgi:hypothetical protein
VGKRIKGVGDCRLTGVPTKGGVNRRLVSAMPMGLPSVGNCGGGDGVIGCSGSSIETDNDNYGVRNGRQGEN